MSEKTLAESNIYLEEVSGTSGSSKILIGMALGIAFGVFVGEDALILSFLGEAFIKMLQMTILPYVIVSLILGFGSLSTEAARKLAINGGLLMLGFWGLGLTLVFALTEAFPSAKHLTFFSSIHSASSAHVNLVDMFIPANFFDSLSSGTVPAVVLFSIIFGVLLMSVEKKQVVLDGLEVVQETFELMSEFVFKLSPLGIFALTATAAGTLRIENLSSLQVYLFTFIGGAVVLVLFWLPYIISALLGKPYGEVFKSIRGAVILGFSSGNSFITLPIIDEAVKTLFSKDYQQEKEKGTSELDASLQENSVLVPVVYNFPSIGVLLTLIFIPFTAWLYDRELEIGQQFSLAFSGLLNMFGDPELALPFLLDSMSLPVDAFELFLLSNVITDPFIAAMEVMCVFAFCAVYVGIASGRVMLSVSKLMRIGSIVAVTLVLLVFLLRMGLSMSVTTLTTERDVLESLAIKNPVQSVVHLEAPEIPKGHHTQSDSKDLLDVIRARGSLKVGYNASALPFAYFNGDNKLVGYDVAMAHDLARILGVKLEFIPFDYATIGDGLKQGHYDIAMSSITINFDRLKEMDFTNHYVKLHLAFLVPDNQRQVFSSFSDIQKIKNLKIAVMRGSAFMQQLEEYLPKAEIVQLDRREQFFTTDVAHAMLTTAEQGAAWTLRYPFNSIALPDVAIGEDFLAYAVAPGNPQLLRFVNQWLSMTRLSAKNEREYSYWIQGQSPDSIEPRWSVMRNVLGWEGF